MGDDLNKYNIRNFFESDIFSAQRKPVVHVSQHTFDLLVEKLVTDNVMEKPKTPVREFTYPCTNTVIKVIEPKIK